MKLIRLYPILICCILIQTCTQNSVGPESQIKVESDYEILDPESDGLLQAGEIFVDTTKIFDVSSRAVLYNMGIDVWKNIQSTFYTHPPFIIDEKTGKYHCDCSAFVDTVILSKSLPFHHKNLVANDPTKSDGRPRAGDFYDYFRSLIQFDKTEGQNTFWKAFMSVDELKPGDLIIIKYDEEWRKKRKEKYPDLSVSTGHVMITFQVGTWHQGNNTIDIRVYDSSSKGHSSDTRNFNKRPKAELLDSHHSGIGIGWMTYKISEEHRRPFAFKFVLDTDANNQKWYNLVKGDQIDISEYYDRLEGIIFARAL